MPLRVLLLLSRRKVRSDGWERGNSITMNTVKNAPLSGEGYGSVAEKGRQSLGEEEDYGLNYVQTAAVMVKSSPRSVYLT